MRKLLRGLGAGLLSLVLIVPPATAELALGTAKGFRSVEISLDSGKNWMPLGPRGLPLLDGALIRSTTGVAVLSLSDGSRITLVASSSVAIGRRADRTEVDLRAGRLMFELPRDTRVDIRTTSAGLEPVRAEAAAGEVFAGNDDLVGVRMSRGTVNVRELAGQQRTLVASLEPVFVPRRPADSSVFTVAPLTATGPVRGVYTPRGESIGYLTQASKLVLQPAFTQDLTQPFQPRVVQARLAMIPDADRPDSTPLFDVNAGYVGYLRNGDFCPGPRPGQTQPVAACAVAQAVGTTAPEAAPGAAGLSTGRSGAGALGAMLAQAVGAAAPAAGAAGVSWLPVGIAIGSVAVVGGVTAAGASGAFEGNPATAIQP